MIKTEVIDENVDINNQNNSKNAQKRLELEKELNIQRNPKNKGKIPNITEAEMNQLNYYNEIAKQNAHGIMNNPTLKDLIRITSDESCLDQLKAKLQSKDLPKILESLPLLRVERINYKNIEIGQIRQKLQSNYNSSVDVKKGKQFASNVFAKRLKQGGKYVPVATIDDLYGENTNKLNKQEENLKKIKKNKVDKNNKNEIWTKKYKQVNGIRVRKKGENIEKNENDDERNKEINVNNNKLRHKRNFYKSEENHLKASNIENQINTKFLKKPENEINKDKDNNIDEKNIKNDTELMDENKNFNSRNKKKSLNARVTESQSIIERNKINALIPINKELNNNENDKNLKNFTFRNRHMRYKSNLEFKNKTLIADQEPIIKINVNKRLNNSNDKNLNIQKSEEKSLKNGNDIPSFYSKVRIKRHGLNKTNK